MKTLYIVRHSKAVKDFDIPDFDRTLVDQGRDDAYQVACRLREQGVAPSVFISSPAARAMETAKIFSVVFKYPAKKIRVRKALYDQIDVLLYIDIVHELADTVNAAVIFGHNPSLTDFVKCLADDFRNELPTTGVIGIEFDTTSWKNITKKSGKICLSDFPQIPKKPEKPKDVQKELEKNLNEDIMFFLNGLDSAVIDNEIEKTVSKSSNKIAREFVKKLFKKH